MRLDRFSLQRYNESVKTCSVNNSQNSPKRPHPRAKLLRLRQHQRRRLGLTLFNVVSSGDANWRECMYLDHSLGLRQRRH